MSNTWARIGLVSQVNSYQYTKYINMLHHSLCDIVIPLKQVWDWYEPSLPHLRGNRTYHFITVWAVGTCVHLHAIYLCYDKNNSGITSHAKLWGSVMVVSNQTRWHHRLHRINFIGTTITCCSSLCTVVAINEWISSVSWINYCWIGLYYDLYL